MKKEKNNEKNEKRQIVIMEKICMLIFILT